MAVFSPIAKRSGGREVCALLGPHYHHIDSPSLKHMYADTTNYSSSLQHLQTSWSPPPTPTPHQALLIFMRLYSLAHQIVDFLSSNNPGRQLLAQALEPYHLRVKFHLIAMLPSANYLTSLLLSFITYKTGNSTYFIGLQ